jgi:hypothetical protein
MSRTPNIRRELAAATHEHVWLARDGLDRPSVLESSTRQAEHAAQPRRGAPGLVGPGQGVPATRISDDRATGDRTLQVGALAHPQQRRAPGDPAEVVQQVRDVHPSTLAPAPAPSRALSTG